jgi:hypothetical protein
MNNGESGEELDFSPDHGPLVVWIYANFLPFNALIKELDYQISVATEQKVGIRVF